MKKSLLMLGVAAMALASCTNNEVMEVADSRTIGFYGTGIDNITKAGDITSGTFAQFYVYGGYEAGTIFDKVSVTKSENNWGYNPAQYWVAGTWNFAGYTGEDGVIPTWDNESGTLTLAINSDATHQSDVVYAEKKGLRIDDPATYNTPVDLNFTHLLSKIRFKFTKEPASLGGVTVKLKDFKVAGITTNAKWTGNVQGNADSPATGDYTDFAEAEVIDGSNGLTTSDFYVIPQGVQAFAITLSAEVTDANGELIHKGNVTASVPTTGITRWDAQNVYAYSAELKMENIIDPEDPDKEPNPIEFTGEASDWEEETSGTVTPD